MQLSHPLPEFLRDFPFYDQLPGRLAAFIRERDGYLACVDVGANIGDTIAAVWHDPSDRFIAIEPDPAFHALLVENWGGKANIELIRDACSSTCAEKAAVMTRRRGGTASTVASEGDVRLRQRTLDVIAAEHANAGDANFLKVDTDGHDFDVLFGARDLLARGHPAVLFECQAFGSPNFVDDCLRVLEMLRDADYQSFFLYDNIGHLLGKFPLADLTPMRGLLFFHLIASYSITFFDVLAVREDWAGTFHESEVNFFAGTIEDTRLRERAVAAALKAGLA